MIQIIGFLTLNFILFKKCKRIFYLCPFCFVFLLIVLNEDRFHLFSGKMQVIGFLVYFLSDAILTF